MSAGNATVPAEEEYSVSCYHTGLGSLMKAGLLVLVGLKL